MSNTDLTEHQAKFYAWNITKRSAGTEVESLGSSLVDARIDLNPHQVEAALFALKNPLSRGVILADEVGLGKTIEAGLVILQKWAERSRRILILVPANLRKQWHQELQDKFGLSSTILEAKNYNAIYKRESTNPFLANQPIICSYQFAKSKNLDISAVPWDLVVFDEAHRLRNVYKPGNVIAAAIRDALILAGNKVLLTATPLQNSLNEFYGLASLIDNHIFGDLASFKSKFQGAGSSSSRDELRRRLAPFLKRTLRKQVRQYVNYTSRKPIVEEFVTSQDEKKLAELVGNYLRRPTLQALPDGQRQLVSLVLWKLLASSPHAIAGALETMANRLKKSLENRPNLQEGLGEVTDDFDALEELKEEWSESNGGSAGQADHDKGDREAIKREVDELNLYRDLALSISQDSKGQALITALDRGLSEAEKLGAARKAIIFTESKKTQSYLLSLFDSSAYKDQVVLFNGTNSDDQAEAIYQQWVARHRDTEKVSGVKSADTRAALVDYFRETASIMIATEAGAEGINLQFCSLVINYDLPWNPQRIEQRIGRCHRYGQIHDVVVVNFLDRSNEADKRVYELLRDKFKLFEGVFGASDEILGAIGSGVDFERRIAEIYRNCREPQEIRESFEALQQELSLEIDEAMLRTRQILIDHFDEEVQEKLKVSADASNDIRSDFEKALILITKRELGSSARFDDDGFYLSNVPSEHLADSVELGRYVLANSPIEGHRYRIGHPLAEWCLNRAKERELPKGKLVLSYDQYGAQISTLKERVGQSGWLAAELIRIETTRFSEEHLVIAAVTSDGVELPERDPEKLLRLPANFVEQEVEGATPDELGVSLEAKRNAVLDLVHRRNLEYFQQEVTKLEAWADDLKSGKEEHLLELDRKIKELRKSTMMAVSLEEKLALQKHQKELELSRKNSRQEIFFLQDEIDERRDSLIEILQREIEHKVTFESLFSANWCLV